MMHAVDRRPFKDRKRELVEDFERRYLHQLLEQHRFDLDAVERSSGLSRTQLWALMDKHGLYKHALRACIGSLRRAIPMWVTPTRSGNQTPIWKELSYLTVRSYR